MYHSKQEISDLKHKIFKNPEILVLQKIPANFLHSLCHLMRDLIPNGRLLISVWGDGWLIVMRGGEGGADDQGDKKSPKFRSQEFGISAVGRHSV